MSLETCTKTIKFSGTTYAIGDPIEIGDTDEVTRLKGLGALADEATKTVDPTSSKDVDGAAPLADIVSAMELLEEDDKPLTKKPTIDALKAEMGDGIVLTGAAVQEAYVAYQAGQGGDE